jgi:hypothetical protein
MEYPGPGTMGVFERKFVSKPKPKTKAQLDRATDLRLQKAYNISLADYNYLDEKGYHGCWVCGRPAANNRLHVDHDHSWKKVKINTNKHEEQWAASAKYNENSFVCFGSKKSLAIRGLKKMLLRASVRGLLCYQHNAGLQKFSDNSVWLLRASDYIDNMILRGSPLSGREAP